MDLECGMYATVDSNEPLSDIVAAASNAEDLFEEEGIDYWFGWKQPLRQACEAAHVAPAEIAFRLVARDRAQRDPSTESLVTLMSALDQHFELKLEPALAAARTAAEKLGKPAGERCLNTIALIERMTRNHVETARRTLSPMAAAIDVGAAATLDEKVVRHMAMEHSLLAVRAGDLRDLAAHSPDAEFAAAARALIRELHQHVKISYNFVFPRLIAATRRPAGYEAW